MVNSGGYPFYGQMIGILVFNGKSPRIIGDPGHAETFSYNVCYEIVDGSFSDLIDGSEKIKNNLIKAAKNLEKKGIRAIAGDCGLMSLYQKEICMAVNVPVITSSLMLIPLIGKMIKDENKIGIITGHSKFLKNEHFKASGVNCMNRIVIQGMENEEHFKEIVIDGGGNFDYKKMESDVFSSVDKLFEKDENVAAILFECSNLGAFSHAVNKKYKLPVFDINTAINILHNSVKPQNF